jgi:hypothetical protein
LGWFTVMSISFIFDKRSLPSLDHAAAKPSGSGTLHVQNVAPHVNSRCDSSSLRQHKVLSSTTSRLKVVSSTAACSFGVSVLLKLCLGLCMNVYLRASTSRYNEQVSLERVVAAKATMSIEYIHDDGK